jgi:L-threonylcarbamoyladenylate synthase
MNNLVAPILSINKSSIELAARKVLEGCIIAYPTDTVYGLGCDPFNESAVQRLFKIKGRIGKPMPVLCRSLKVASRLVELSGYALRVAKKYWPGPLTIVAPIKIAIPSSLHQGTNWVGVRVPARKDCIDLIKKVGGYMTGTSANLSGLPSCRSAGEVSKMLGENIELILDGGRLEGRESTVIRVNDGDVEVLRRGSISLELGIS